MHEGSRRSPVISSDAWRYFARGGGRSVVAGGEVEGLEGGVVVVGVIYLEGGVGDPELVSEELFEVAAAGVAVLLVADEDVGG
jgi:hypothetical protein